MSTNDAGVYKCVAENQHGEAESSTELVVLCEYGQPPIFVEFTCKDLGLRKTALAQRIVNEILFFFPQLLLRSVIRREMKQFW